jgi:hypothetical protein
MNDVQWLQYVKKVEAQRDDFLRLLTNVAYGDDKIDYNWVDVMHRLRDIREEIDGISPEKGI